MDVEHQNRVIPDANNLLDNRLDENNVVKEKKPKPIAKRISHDNNNANKFEKNKGLNEYVNELGT